MQVRRVMINLLENQIVIQTLNNQSVFRKLTSLLVTKT